MYRLIAATALALLAGCEGKKPDDEAVLEQAAKLAEPLPGQYRSTTTFAGYELPNADTEDARIVRERLSKVSPQVREFCMTPEEAEGGFRTMLASMQDGDCTIERFAAHRGRLDAAMRCSMTGGGTSTIAMSGTADPQSSHVTLEIDQLSDGLPGGLAKMKVEIENERIGDCS